MMSFIAADISDALHDAVACLIAKEEDGQIIYATPMLEEMFGYTMKGELAGLSVEDLVPTAKRTIHKDVHRMTYKANPTIRSMGKGLTLQGQRRDGTVFPIAVTLRGRVIAGVRCNIASIMDMTAQVTHT